MMPPCEGGSPPPPPAVRSSRSTPTPRIRTPQPSAQVVDDRRRRVRPPDAARSLRHLAPALFGVEERAHLGSQRLGRQRALSNGDRGACACERVRVDRLVIVGGERVRDQDRGPTDGADLGDRGRAGARDDHGGRRVRGGHVLDEGCDLRVDAEATVGPGDLVPHRLARLMQDGDPSRGEARARQRFGHHGVERASTLRAAEHEHLPRTRLESIRVRERTTGGLDERAANGVARDADARGSERRRRLREAHVRPPDDGREHPIRHADARVLLEDRRRDTERGRGGEHRSGRVTAHAEHEARTMTANDAHRAGHRDGKSADALQELEGRASLQRGHLDELERLAELGDHPRFDAALGSDEDDLHVGIAAPKLFDDRDAREEVPARPASRDQDSFDHVVPPEEARPRRFDRRSPTRSTSPVPASTDGVGSRERETFKRIPIAAQFTSSDDPP